MIIIFDYECFLYDKNDITQLYKVNIFKSFISIYKYMRMVYMYKKKGFGFAKEILQNQFNKRFKHIIAVDNTYTKNELLYASSKYIRIYRIFGKIVNESSLCLERSIALTFALNYLNIPCKLVLGKSRYFMNENYNFHSWVEIKDYPLNDHIGVKKQWARIYSLPKT